MVELTYDGLRSAVGGAAVGLRACTALEPLGGPNDKVFPPTYGVDRGAKTKYAVETRRHGGNDVTAVVLDSVASQANRFETALLDGYRRGELAIPLVSVDFRETEAAWLGRLSALEAPHRIFDALLRDSLLDDVLFRFSDPGRAVTEATPRNATSVFHYSPTTLLFGGWDSTGPKGGRGAKYERAITSEIVGYGVALGVKTASRMDPAGVEKGAGPLYQTRDGDWTLRTSEAVQDKGQPKKYARPGTEGDPGRPSKANHGNIAPSIDTMAGGVTVDSIVATTVLSFAALRRLRFPLDKSGEPLDGRRAEAETAARTAIAALGIAAAVLAFDEGFDLRSRCVLYAPEALTFELLQAGSEPHRNTVSRQEALELVRTASAAAAEAGLGWPVEELLLTPAPKLVDLIHRSRELAVEGGEE